MTQFKWHEADSKLVHGIADTADLLVTGDSAPPNGAAGGDLTGTYPNPTIANYTPGAWPSWTPTLAQGVTTDIAKTIAYAKDSRQGRTINANMRLNITGAGTAGSSLTFTLPVTAASLAGSRIGTFSYFDASVGAPWYVGLIYAGSTNVAYLLDTTQGNDVGVLPNIAAANGDVLQVELCYEAAS